MPFRPLPTPTLRVLGLACAALALAACAARAPAPIVSRTAPPPVQPRPAEPPVAAPQPAPAPVPEAAPPAPAVETAPVRSGSVESRGVESRPLEPRPGTPGAAPTVPPLPPNARTGPRGGKVPWSDTALAELRAGEGASPQAGGSPAGAAPAAPGPGTAAPGTSAPGSAAATPGAAAPAAGAAPNTPPAPSAAAPGSPAAADGDWAWPVAGRVVQSFDESGTKGLVLAGKPGDPVLAAADGRVIFSGVGPRGYGNLVIVKHAGELLSVYAHNRSLAVKEGQAVKRGQKIAEVGDSGTTSPRLHFEIRQQGKPVDPAKYLPRR